MEDFENKYDTDLECSENESNYVEESCKIEPSMPNSTEAIEHFTEVATKQIEQGMVNSSKEMDFKEGSKAIAHMVMTAEALNKTDENEQFLDEIKKEKQEEIKQSFVSEKLKEEASMYAAKQTKAEAFYINVRPILEFDFSPLIPKKSKTVLFKRKHKEEIAEDTTISDETVQTHQPTYKDRSYGIPLMIFMLIWLTIPYFVITFILAICNGVNAVFNGIARFGKPALIICGASVGIAICILAIYGMCSGVDALFGTNIITSILGK